MNTSILVAVDLTHRDDAARILKEAKRLADIDGAQLSAVTVIPDYGMSIVGGFFKEGAEGDAMAHAAEALHGVTEAALGAGVGVQHVVRHGSAYEEILAAADLIKADLIVLGAHKPNYGDYFLGPNAARVVRHAKVSVLVLRD